MDFKRLSRRAKDLVEKRGGTEALKADAEELRRIAKGSGSLGDKAKAAADALKHPGDGEREATERGTGAERSAAEAAAPAERERAASKVSEEGRGKHKHAE